MIFAARQVQEKCIEQNLNMYMVSVDLTKAVDTISIDGLWQILRKIGCPDLFVDIIRSFQDQFHMRCLRRIANIKWQDMIPNTEVLQRCAQTGIEQHIKRAQLRWSGHLVRMADNRIPKAVFDGEQDAGHRTRGGQRKRYKDVLKATLKSCGIPHYTREATAIDRALWRSTCHSGLRDYVEKRCDALRD